MRSHDPALSGLWLQPCLTLGPLELCLPRHRARQSPQDGEADKASTSPAESVPIPAGLRSPASKPAVPALVVPAASLVLTQSPPAPRTMAQDHAGAAAAVKAVGWATFSLNRVPLCFSRSAAAASMQPAWKQPPPELLESASPGPQQQQQQQQELGSPKEQQRSADSPSLHSPLGKTGVALWNCQPTPCCAANLTLLFPLCAQTGCHPLMEPVAAAPQRQLRCPTRASH